MTEAHLLELWDESLPVVRDFSDTRVKVRNNRECGSTAYTYFYFLGHFENFSECEIEMTFEDDRWILNRTLQHSDTQRQYQAWEKNANWCMIPAWFLLRCAWPPSSFRTARFGIWANTTSAKQVCAQTSKCIPRDIEGKKKRLALVQKNPRKKTKSGGRKKNTIQNSRGKKPKPPIRKSRLGSKWIIWG